MKGNIFNIQKFSIHDGPGIRTTVFLKGCPLRCLWCANPESQDYNIQLLYDADKCIHCQSCVKACKSGALTHENNKIVVDYSKFDGNLDCVKVCPTHALTNEGEYMSVEDVVKVCLQDKDFYEESDGGITISGGEGMSQPAFLKELIPVLKSFGLHTAIETTGYIHKETFKELAVLFDLLLFDIKHYDSKKHFLGTHVYNELIIENLKWAIEQHLNILPRIPVIPHFNASLEDAKGLADLVSNLGLQKVQLLPFHQMGEKKYQLLNRKYEFKNVKALYPEDLQDYRKVFLDKNLDCFF